MAQGDRTAGSARAGQPVGQLVDRDYVLERMAALQLDRGELLRRAGRLISPRTLRRVLNADGARLSLSSAAVLAELLECGSRDLLVPSAPIAERIASFGLDPHPPFADSFGEGRPRRPWIARAEEPAVLAGLEARRPVVVLGAARSGKTSLARRMAARLADRYPRGAVWLDGDRDPDRARGAIAECLGLFHPFPAGEALTRVLDERFARILWSRRRLVVLDDAREASRVMRLLGRYRGPMDLVVLTDQEQVALELERQLGQLAVRLSPLSDAQALTFLLAHHPGDERLREGLDAGVEGALPRALAGSPIALEAVEEALRGAAPGRRALLDAISGRPDAMDFASDQLRLTRLATLPEIALRVARSETVNSPLLRAASEEARRFFFRLAALDGIAAPIAWAAAAGGVAVDQARRLCDELALVLHHPGDGRVSISPHLRQFAASALGAAERAGAEDRLLHRARDEARAIGRLPPPAAMAALREAEPLLLSCLARVGPGGDPAQPSPALQLLSPLRHLLPGWRAEALEPALAAAVGYAGEDEALLAEAHHLRLAMGRWLLVRADHARAAELFQAAAEGFIRLRRPLEAADARAEQGVVLFSTGRGDSALPLYHEAVELARRGEAPASVLARHLDNLAFAETRRPDGGPGHPGWAAARAALDEAARALGRAGDDDGQLPWIVAVNRGLVGRVLGEPGWKPVLRTALGGLLERTPAGDVFGAYLLGTATGCGLLLLSSLEEQRRRARDLWWGALEGRGLALGDSLRRFGQMAYYLNDAGRGGQLVREGVMATDPPLPVVARYGGSLAALFLVEPTRPIFDEELLAAAARFVWSQGGPHNARTLEELERLRAWRTQGPRPGTDAGQDGPSSAA